ncbi:hypothetical protein FRC12_009936 [Ceratobasidium sp. 428]|nr:hypothetical protein FRC12_009936 [Ceratobasidium sp. 428]
MTHWTIRRLPPLPNLKATPGPDSDSSNRHMSIDKPNHEGDSDLDEESASLDDEGKALSLSPPRKHKVLWCVTDYNHEDEDIDDGGNGDNEGASESKGWG